MSTLDMTSEVKRPGPGTVASTGKAVEPQPSPDQQKYNDVHTRLKTVLVSHGIDPDHPAEGEFKDEWTGNSGTVYSVSVVSPTGPENLRFLAIHNGQRWSFSYKQSNPVTGVYLQYFLWEDNPRDPQKPFLKAFATWNIPTNDLIGSLGDQGRLREFPSEVNVFEKFDALLQDLSPQQQSDSQTIPSTSEVE